MVTRKATYFIPVLTDPSTNWRPVFLDGVGHWYEDDFPRVVRVTISAYGSGCSRDGWFEFRGMAVTDEEDTRVDELAEAFAGVALAAFAACETVEEHNRIFETIKP